MFLCVKEDKSLRVRLAKEPRAQYQNSVAKLVINLSALFQCLETGNNNVCNSLVMVSSNKLLSKYE